MHFFQSPRAHYTLLPWTGHNDSSADNGGVYSVSCENLENFSSHKHIPVYRSWRYVLSLGIFLAGVLVGAGLIALGSSYSKHRYLPENPDEIVGVKDFAPQTSAYKSGRLFPEARALESSERDKSALLGCLNAGRAWFR